MGIFSLDQTAVRRWNRRSGAPAFWFPEPPVPDVDPVEGRRGCILYGALAPRKGVDRLAAALSRDSSGMYAVVAGSVERGYADELDRLVRVMRAGGARVDVRAWPHEEKDGLGLLAAARCAILPYHRHSGMSRVLLEAAAARTPVLAHDHGLIAALVRQHGIGLVVDCADPLAFRRAVQMLCGEGEATRYRPALDRFAALYSRERFAAALREPFGLEPVEPALVLTRGAR
jgi:glycosyltransferase involved in cell wall biosynthesis